MADWNNLRVEVAREIVGYTANGNDALERAGRILAIPAIREALSLAMQMDAAIEEFEARGGVAEAVRRN